MTFILSFKVLNPLGENYVLRTVGFDALINDTDTMILL